MNVQTVRLALAEVLPGYFSDWAVSLDAWIELNATKTVQIGHAPPIPATFRAQSIDLPVVLWVNEADQADAVNDMYLAISFDTGTAIRLLADGGHIIQLVVEAVGPRDNGPSGYIAADLVWKIQVTNT